MVSTYNAETKLYNDDNNPDQNDINNANNSNNEVPVIQRGGTGLIKKGKWLSYLLIGGAVLLTLPTIRRSIAKITK